MKVMQINCNCKNGSTGKIVRMISEEMNQAGIENKVICSGYHEETDSVQNIPISNWIGVKIDQVLSCVFGDAGFHSRLQTAKALQIIKREAPDIVHLHNLHGYYINISMLLGYLKKRNIRTVITLHDCWMMTGHCVHYYRTGCTKWMSGCCSCVAYKEYPYSWFFDKSKHLYKKKKILLSGWENLKLVAVSNWLKDEASKSILKEYACDVIPSGIDTSVFYPDEDLSLRTKYGLENRFIILGVAINWSDRKGLAKFIKMAECIDDSYHIVLIGLDKEQIGSLPTGILGLPKTNNAHDLRKWYSTADVFVNMSLEETMGLVTAEAMACGTPAIVFNSTANPELIRERCGYIAKPNDIGDVLTGIAKIRKNGKAYYTDFCRNNVLRNYNAAVQFKKYIELYQTIEKE